MYLWFILGFVGSWLMWLSLSYIEEFEFVLTPRMILYTMIGSLAGVPIFLLGCVTTMFAIVKFVLSLPPSWDKPILKSKKKK